MADPAKIRLPEIDETVPTYRQALRTGLGHAKTQFLAEEISEIFNTVAHDCPEVLRERPPHLRGRIDFSATMDAIGRDLGINDTETRRMVMKNPYLLFEELEDFSAQAAKSGKGQHTPAP